MAQNIKKPDTAAPAPHKGKRRFVVAMVIILVLILLPFLLKGILEKHLLKLFREQVIGTVHVKKFHLGVSRAEIEDLRITHESGETWISAQKIELRYNLFRALEKPLGQKAFISVDIYRPSVVLKYDQKGHLNLYSLFRERPKKEPSPLLAEGLVRIHQGSFTFGDPRFNDFSRTAYPIDGSVSLRGEKGIFIDRLNVAIKDSRGKGVITGSLPPDFKGGVFRIKGDNIDGAPWVNYIINDKAFIVEEALVKADGILSSPDFSEKENLVESLDLHANIHLYKGKARLSFLPDPVTDLKGDVTVTMDMVRLKDVRGAYNKAPVKVDGRIYNFGKTSLALNVEIPEASLEKMKKQPVISAIPFENKGKIKIRAGVDGLLSSPVVSGNVEFDRITLKDEPIEKGNADFTYYSGAVKWNLNQALWQGGLFRGSGYINVEDHPLHFFLGIQGKNADAGRFASFLMPDYPVKATSDFDVSIIGTVDKPIIFGNSSFSGLHYDKFALNRGSAHFIYWDDDLLLSDLKAQADKGRVYMPRGHVNLKHRFMNLDLFATGLDFNSVYRSKLPLENAAADVRAKVIGSFKSPFIYGDFSDGSGRYNDNDFNKSSGNFYYSFSTNMLLARGITDLKDSTLQLMSSMVLDKSPKGHLIFEAGHLKPSYLSSLNPGFKNFTGEKRVNLKGFVTGEKSSMGWGFTGAGPLGNLAGVGKWDPGPGNIQGAFLGYDVDFNQFIPSNASGSLTPGRGNAAVLIASGNRGMKSYFTLNTPKGRAMGLPLTASRGILSINKSRISLEDVYLEGTAPLKTGDSRIQLTQDLYKLSTYWGIDTSRDRRTSLLARMYYAPYIFQGYTYTTDGWKINTLAPVSLGGIDPLKGPYSGIDGLPGLWKNQSIQQLKQTGSPGYPLSVEISSSDGKDRQPEKQVRILDASINGTFDTARGTMDLNIDGRNVNLGFAGRNLNLKSAGIDLKDIQNVIATDSIEGDADLKGRLKGPWKSPLWEGSVRVENGIIGNEPFMVESFFKAHSKGLDIISLILMQARSTYRGGGNITLKPEPAFNLTMDTDGGKLSRILSFTPWKNLKATGLVYGRLNLSGSPEKLKIDGDVSVKDSRILGQPVSNLSMTFKSGNDSIILENLQAGIGDGTISGSGIMKDGKLDFNFNAVQFPLEEVEILKSAFRKISGTGSANLAVFGTMKNPEAILDIYGENVRLKENLFDKAGGSFLWEDGTLVFKNVTLSQARQYWNAEGKVRFPGKSMPADWKGWSQGKNRPHMEISSQIRDFSIETALDLANHPLKDQLKGKLTGDVALSGSFPAPDFSINLRADDGIIGKIPYKTINASAGLKGNRLDIKDLSYLSGDAMARGTGHFDTAGKTVDFNAQMNNMPVQLAGTFIKRARKFDGYVNGSVRIWGAPETPDLEAKIFVEEGKMGSFPFDRAGGLVTAEKGLLTFKDLSIEKDNHKIGFTGEIPFAFKNGALVNTSPIKISTRINEKNLDLLGLVIPFVQKTSGEIRGGMSITGIYPDLDIRGGARIKNGSVKLSIMDNEVSAINADVFFNGKEFLVKALTGSLGEGTFNVNGYARIDDEKVRIEDMIFTLVGENMQVMMPGLIRGTVDTKVTLTGNQDRMIIGSLDPEKDDFFTIKKATVNLPGGQLKDISQLIPKPKEQKNGKNHNKKGKQPHPEENGNDSFSFPMPEITKFIVTLGEDVWMEHKGLLIQSGGSLMMLRKPEQSVRIFGELAFTRGTLNIPFFSNTFKVNQGIAYFHGGDPVIDKKTGQTVDYSLNPFLEMNAETLVSSTEVFMSYNGALEDLQAAMKPGSTIRADLNIYSIPTLSKEDIMRLLLGGTVIGSITDNGSVSTSGGQNFEGAAISALSSYILNPITRSFGRTFSLSDISLQYSPVGAVTLRISKALDQAERFFVTYSQFKPPQGDSMDIWGIEYKYRPGMRIRIEDYQDTFTYSLQGRVEFDTFPEFWRELFKSANFFNTKNK